MSRLLPCCRAVAVVVASAASFAWSQEMPTPQREHREMAREEGVWDGEAKVWLAPGAPPMTSSCSETCQMLGGFWLVTEFKGEFGGMPFSGRSQLGYDPESGEYMSTWVDSMAPALFVSRGGYDASTNTLTLRGEGKDWMTGESKQTKLVIKYTDADHKQFEVHERATESDDWRKTMQIDYERRK